MSMVFKLYVVRFIFFRCVYSRSSSRASYSFFVDSFAVTTLLILFVVMFMCVVVMDDFDILVVKYL